MGPRLTSPSRERHLTSKLDRACGRAIVSLKTKYLNLENNDNPGDSSNEVSNNKPLDAPTNHDERSQPNTNDHRSSEKRRKERPHPLEWAIGLMLFFTLVATSCAAKFAHDQTVIADDTEKRSLRAYLGVNNEDIALNCAACGNQNKVPSTDFYSDEDMISLPVQNYGQTPAFDGQGLVGLKGMPPNQELPTNFDYPLGEINQREPVKTYAWVLEPHEINHFGAFLDKVNLDLVNKARNREIWLYVYGQITYVDAFSCTAKVIFCFRYIPDNEAKHQFVFCPEHNRPAKECERPK